MNTIQEYPIIKDRKINIALIGCGRISLKHVISIFHHSKDLNLVALCDTNIQNIKEIQNLITKEARDKKFAENVQIYEKYDDLISNKNKGIIHLDLVVLATPSGLHASQPIKAARNGIHICTEKPMATNWEEGQLMVNECEKNNVYLFVVKQNRYNKTIQLLKRQIASNRFGKISIISVNVFWQRPQSYYDKDEWRGTKNLDGGALMNQASHYVDLMYWLNGPIESLNAVSDTLGREIEVEDTLVMNLKWKNGTLGTMAVTMLTYPENLEGSITILGEKGTVKLGGKAINNFEYWNFESSNEDDLYVENSNYKTSNIYGFGHPVFYKDMIKTIRGTKTDICKGNDGLKSLEIIIAAYKSAKTGTTIKLPF